MTILTGTNYVATDEDALHEIARQRMILNRNRKTVRYVTGELAKRLRDERKT